MPAKTIPVPKGQSFRVWIRGDLNEAIEALRDLAPGITIPRDQIVNMLVKEGLAAVEKASRASRR